MINGPINQSHYLMPKTVMDSGKMQPCLGAADAVGSERTKTSEKVKRKAEKKLKEEIRPKKIRSLFGAGIYCSTLRV